MMPVPWYPDCQQGMLSAWFKMSGSDSNNICPAYQVVVIDTCYLRAEYKLKFLILENEIKLWNQQLDPIANNIFLLHHCLHSTKVKACPTEKEGTGPHFQNAQIAALVCWSEGREMKDPCAKPVSWQRNQPFLIPFIRNGPWTQGVALEVASGVKITPEQLLGLL